jgi:hypothetical protein
VAYLKIMAWHSLEKTEYKPTRQRNNQTCK